MRILILGATGQIGQMVFKGLSGQKGAIVHGTSRKSHHGLQRFDPLVDDWQHLGKCDVLINCIGIIKEQKEISFDKIHIGLVNSIIANREIIGMPRIVHISALGADSASKIPFLRSKGEADLRLLTQEDVCIVRPSVVCTPGTMMVQKLRMVKRFAAYMRVLLFPEGFMASAFQPILADDLYELIEKLVCDEEYKGGSCVVDATGPEKITYGELLKIAKVNIAQAIIMKREHVGLLIRLFPWLINRQQYELIFSDNVADAALAQDILKRKMASTLNFWRQNLS